MGHRDPQALREGKSPSQHCPARLQLHCKLSALALLPGLPTAQPMQAKEEGKVLIPPLSLPAQG